MLPKDVPEWKTIIHNMVSLTESIGVEFSGNQGKYCRREARKRCKVDVSVHCECVLVKYHSETVRSTKRGHSAPRCIMVLQEKLYSRTKIIRKTKS